LFEFAKARDERVGFVEKTARLQGGDLRAVVEVGVGLNAIVGGENVKELIVGAAKLQFRPVAT
jgi:hypothetical protein